MPNGHVLVVEDDDAIRHLLIECLKQQILLTVEGARDGVEALHFISHKPYGVVILDLMMPKMSGGDFLDSLTAMAKDPSIQSLGAPPVVIVVTGAAAGDVPTDTIIQRSPLVRAVLRKPVDIAKLAELIESL